MPKRPKATKGDKEGPRGSVKGRSREDYEFLLQIDVLPAGTIAEYQCCEKIHQLTNIEQFSRYVCRWQDLR
jgi:hypothetical protein